MSSASGPGRPLNPQGDKNNPASDPKYRVSPHTHALQGGRRDLFRVRKKNSKDLHVPRRVLFSLSESAAV